jgi:hypothetical protein
MIAISQEFTGSRANNLASEYVERRCVRDAETGRKNKKCLVRASAACVSSVRAAASHGRPSFLPAAIRKAVYPCHVPLLIALAFAAVVMLAAIALMPLSLVQRYRVGTARRQARGWIVTINVVGIALSVFLFVMGAAVTNVWVPNAFRYALMGLAGGGMLGVAGLALTRWEVNSRSLHYTPNRWLVLGITLVVTARILYGFWRSWQAWRLAAGDMSWVAASGVAGSLAAGAVVLGYYLIYWLGVRRRLRRVLW